MSDKGKWCPYKAALFCQEGYCSNCEIYLSRGKKKPRAGDENVHKEKTAPAAG